MNRRELIRLLGGAAISLPPAASAQQPTRPVIGFLSGAMFEPMQGFIVAFQQGLTSAGLSDGHDLAIEYRWAEGHNDRLPALAADLVRLQVAVIVAAANPVAGLEGAHFEAEFTQSINRVEPAHSGADDNRVELRGFRGANRHFGAPL